MRNRLTAKTLKADPGFVGNPDRKDPRIDEYDNYKFLEGYDTVDNENTWEDERGEANFPVHSSLEGGKIRASMAATAARIRTASKATILAQMLLGEKAPVSEIKAQAKEFMPLGYHTICSSIRRWVATAPEEEDLQFGDEVEAPAAPAAQAPAQAPAQEPAAPAAQAPVQAPVNPELAQAPAQTQAQVPATPDGGQLQQEVADLEGADDAVNAPVENTEAPDMVIDIPEQQENIGNEVLDPNAQLGQGQADPMLEQAFSDNQAAPAVEAPAAPAPVAPAPAQAPQAQAPKAAKVGIRHLAAQPKLASAKMTIEDLSNLWDGLKIKGI